MFDSLVPLLYQQVLAAADALYRQDPVAFRVDPGGTHVVMVATPEKPYELDFVCVEDVVTMRPQAMTVSDRDKLTKWAYGAVRAICRAWKKRHPDGPHAVIA